MKFVYRIIFKRGQAYWVNKGLELVQAEAIKEINDIESKGKNALMTKGFVNQMINEISDKIEEITLKPRNGYSKK